MLEAACPLSLNGDRVKDILSLKLYARVARLGSFSAAARESGMSQPQVSRIIADLENELGARLLTRSTRAVVLTEAGAGFLARIEPILLALEEAEHSVRDCGELRGTLRMSMPTSVGTKVVIPLLQPFAERHPDLRIEVHLGDRMQDLVKDAVDVAIRLGRLPDSTATATLITKVTRVVVASPRYLAQHGTPAAPEDLTRHRIVGGPASMVPNAWRFRRQEQEIAVELESHFHTTENEGAVAAAAAGLGITSTSEWAASPELRDGRLVRVLADWPMAGIPAHASFPMARDTRAAGRAVIDYLIAELRRDQAAADTPE